MAGGQGQVALLAPRPRYGQVQAAQPLLQVQLLLALLLTIGRGRIEGWD